MFTTNYKLAALLLAAATASASPLAPRQGDLLEVVNIDIDIDIDIVAVIDGLNNNGGQDAYTLKCLRGEEEGYNANAITSIDVDILLGEIDLEALLQQLGLSDILDIEDFIDLSVVLNLGGNGTVQITLGEIIRRLSGGNQYGGYNGGYEPAWTYGECRDGAFANGELCLNPLLCPILQAILPAFPLLGCPTSQYGPGWGYGDDYASAPMPTDWKPTKYCEKSQLCKADQYGAYNCEDSKWCKPTTPESDYLPATPEYESSEGGNDYPSAPAYEGSPHSGYPGGYNGAGRCRNDELTVDLDLAVEVDIDLVSVSVQADAVITLGSLSSGCAEQRCQRMCEANSYRGNAPAGRDCRAFATYNDPATDDVLCALYGDVIVAANFEEGDFAVRAFNLNIDIEVTDVAGLV